MEIKNVLCAGAAAAAGLLLSTQAPTVLTVSALAVCLGLRISSVSNTGVLPAILGVFSQMGSVSAMQGGHNLAPGAEKSIASLSTVWFSRCSGLVIGEKTVLTASHCLGYNKSLIAKDSNGIIMPCSSVSYAPRGDLIVIDFPRPLTKALCVDPTPMLPEHHNDFLKEAYKEPNACGVGQNVLVVGRGLKNDYFAISPDKTAHSGLFQADTNTRLHGSPLGSKEPSISFNPASPDGVHIQGVGKGVVKQGDSGGPVYGCNPNTKKFELIGVACTTNSASSVVNNEENYKWYLEHVSRVKPVACAPKYTLTPFDLYPEAQLSSENLPKDQPAAATCHAVNIGSKLVTVKNQCRAKSSVKYTEFPFITPDIITHTLVSPGETMTFSRLHTYVKVNTEYTDPSVQEKPKPKPKLKFK